LVLTDLRNHKLPAPESVLRASFPSLQQQQQAAKQSQQVNKYALTNDTSEPSTDDGIESSSSPRAVISPSNSNDIAALLNKYRNSPAAKRSVVTWSNPADSLFGSYRRSTSQPREEHRSTLPTASPARADDDVDDAELEELIRRQQQQSQQQQPQQRSQSAQQQAQPVQQQPQQQPPDNSQCSPEPAVPAVQVSDLVSSQQRETQRTLEELERLDFNKIGYFSLRPATSNASIVTDRMSPPSEQ